MDGPIDCIGCGVLDDRVDRARRAARAWKRLAKRLRSSEAQARRQERIAVQNAGLATAACDRDKREAESLRARVAELESGDKR